MTNRIVAGAVVLLAASTISAQPAPTSVILSDYTPTSWNERDGLPSSRIRSIAQDGEGYLWLGTDAGLVRFDGTRFVVSGAGTLPAVRQAAVGMVRVALDQTIWVWFLEGGLSHITRHGVVNYDERSGIGTGAVSTLVEGIDGAMWLGSDAGLHRFDGQRWGLWSGRAHHLPTGAVTAAFVDAKGNLLVALADGIYSLGRDQTAFQLMATLDKPIRDLTEDRSGAVWVTDPLYGFRALDENEPVHRGSERGGGTRLFFDQRGDLWVGTLSQGVWRVESPDDPARTIIKKASILSGLSGNGVRCLVEDRDGNVWAGNSGGLNRLTPKKASAVTDLGIVRSVQSGIDGRVWAATDDQMISLSATTTHRFPPQFLKLPAGDFPATDVDRDGNVWIAANATLSQINRTGVIRWGLVRPRPLRQIETIASDSHGGLWIYDHREGLLRWHDGELERFRSADAFTGAQVVASDADSRGAAWFTFDDGTIAMVTVGGVRLFGPRDGLDGGVYQAIYEDRDDVMWFAGTRGLSRSIGDGRFHTFHAANGLPAEPLTAIVADEQQSLWIAGTSGIYRIAAEELKKAQDAPSYRLHYAVLDSSDGVAGHPLSAGFGNRLATRATDGRLWFVTGRGLTIIDPRLALRSRPGLRAAHIEQVIANGQPLSATSFLHLPTGTTRIDIRYDIVDLTAPHKTRFRYKLDDVDSDWREAGTARQASYANLGPRAYRFHVATNDESGYWTDTDRMLDFDILPAFYQTRWFYALCASFACLATWGIWRLRLDQIQRQFAVRLEERTRLSREIHDTLLQSMVGIALQCELIAGDADRPAAVTSDSLLRLRRQVEGYVRELRQAIWALRSPQAPLADLASALQQAGERATEVTDIEFEFAVAGFPRPCNAEVEDQLLRIGQEAITNAVRHADASHITMELRYERSAVALRVADNGHGFDVLNIARTAGGHYGLIGMRERAESVGAILQVNSSVGGTAVEAIVPATMPVEVSA